MPVTAKQMEYLARAWQCFTEEPKIDWEKFRSLSNLTTLASARETLRQAKKKLKDEHGDSAITLPISPDDKPVTQKTTSRVKSTDKSSGTGDEETSDIEPAVAVNKKPARGRKRSATAAAKGRGTSNEADDDDLGLEDVNEEISIKPAKKARKTPVKAGKAGPKPAFVKGRGNGRKKAAERIDEVMDSKIHIKAEATESGQEEDEEEEEEEDAEDEEGKSHYEDAIEQNETHGNDSEAEKDGSVAREAEPSSPIVYEFEPL